MEWWLTLIILIGSLIVMLATGIPVAFAFLLLVLVGSYIWFGGQPGMFLLIRNIFESVTSFVLIPIPLFVLMGELMFCSGITEYVFDVLDKWLGRLPGRLSLMAVGAGTLLSALSGSSAATTAILGASLVPETEKRGYSKSMSLGPILGSGGLALMIPPSGLAVFLAAVAKLSVAGVLIGAIIPGVLMALFYAGYIVITCLLKPSIAPPYTVPPTPLGERIRLTVRHVLPLTVIVFMVTGVIFFGIATPSEAAATGALGTLIVIASYKRLNWGVIKKSLEGTIRITLMMFMILATAKAFSQILAVSGATRGLAEFVVGLPLPTTMMVIGMLVVGMLLGMFMGATPNLMIAMPIFMPLILTLGVNPVWFGVLYLLCLEMGQTSPPFGGSCFVMKGVAPPDTTMGDIYRASLPYLGCDAIVMALMLAFPALVVWLPNLIR